MKLANGATALDDMSRVGALHDDQSSIWPPRMVT
jgi:hypothetical protein